MKRNELGKLFAAAQSVGRKYMTADERNAHEQELYCLRRDIKEMAKAMGL